MSKEVKPAIQDLFERLESNGDIKILEEYLNDMKSRSDAARDEQAIYSNSSALAHWNGYDTAIRDVIMDMNVALGKASY